MQEPLDNASEEARNVHAYLDQNAEAAKQPDEIAAAIGLSEGEVANALRELQAGNRAAESFGGWSVVK